MTKAQKPIAWIAEFENGEQELHFEEPTVGETITPLYTTSQKRPWVGLTDEIIENIFQSAADADEETHIRFARAIEQHLKSKNT